MRRLQPQPDWPESWRTSYAYDLLEVYGELHHRGYAYAYANRRKHTLELVAKAVPPGARVLDLAAAQGNFTLALEERGYAVTWNDLRAELADYVKLKDEKMAVRYLPGNAFDLSLEGFFDAALIAEVIEHVAHPDQFLRKVGRLVKPGGYVVMTTPNGEYVRHRLPKFSECQDPSRFEAAQFGPNADSHVFLLHSDELEPLAARSGLRIMETRLITNPLTFGHLGLEPLLRLLPRSIVDALENASQRLPSCLKRRWLACFAVLFQRQAE